MTNPGEEMARAVAARDRDTLASLFTDSVTFRGLTPSRSWEAATPAEVAELFLREWFDDEKNVVGLAELESSTVGDVHKVTYRMSVQTESGPEVIEQVAYFEVDAGLISRMRLICSGFRPA
jgi:hypothetical protein